jgi:hypothetical protein
MDGLRLAVDSARTKCRITPHELRGCYHCQTGGEFRFSCVTDNDATLASVECEDGTIFAQKCTSEPTDYSVVLPFNRSNVDTTCTVRCPAGSTTFPLKGQLAYIPKRLRTKFSSRIANHSGDTGGWLSGFGLDFDFDMLAILQTIINPMNLLIVIGVAVFALFCVFTFLHLNPIFRGYKLLAARMIIYTIIISTINAASHDHQEEYKTSIILTEEHQSNNSTFILQKQILMSYYKLPLLEFLFGFDTDVNSAITFLHNEYNREIIRQQLSFLLNGKMIKLRTHHLDVNVQFYEKNFGELTGTGAALTFLPSHRSVYNYFRTTTGGASIRNFRA